MAKSLTFNFFEDDLTIRNYLALTAMILNPKLKRSTALNLFGISEKENNSKVKENSDIKK